MPLESANYIGELDESWPLGGDTTNRGDDHLRLIKHVLATQFPGVNGNGFEEAIIATEQELNWLAGLTDNVQVQFDDLNQRITDLESSLPAPAGTELIFYQAAPPTGWTMRVDMDDYMLRVISTSGGGSGGVDSPIVMDKVPSHTHDVSEDNTGAHTHNIGQYYGQHVGNNPTPDHGVTAPNVTSGLTSSGGNHVHNVTVGANPGAANWEPKYLDTIIGIKD